MRLSATRKVLTAWPYALGLCVLLTATRFAACHRDAAPYGNAWTEDHEGRLPRRVWPWVAGIGTAIVIAFHLKWGHVTIVGGAGG